MNNTAVILTARKERGSDIPFPLKPFWETTCLIDRTLSLLRELGYGRIFIVTGYRSELFEQYRGLGITLVYNPNYEFTSSMGSLAVLQDHITDDFLLIEGDTFYEKKVLEQLSRVHEGNCFTVTEESGSGDECFVESRFGYITKISKDRHRVCNFEGELLGVSRITIETYKKMLELWSRSTNPLLNYEYVLMDVTSDLDRPYIFFKNLIWGDVDTPEDFKRLKEKTWRMLCRRENPFDEENLHHHLKEIFPEEDIDRAEIVQIGGMSNKNFRVELNGRCYVLRVPGNGSEGMVERLNEEFNAQEGSRMGVNPVIRYFNARTGVKLADYIENAETLNAATIQRHDNMRKVAEIYRKIHGSRVRLKNEFNIFQEIEKYDGLIESAKAKMYDGWEVVKPRVMDLENALNKLGVDLKPCHNDAVAENFIKASDGTLYLIDWEYSGMNDPMADFAALFLENSFTEENEDYVLTKYYDGTIPPDTKSKILIYEILWDTLWSQWTVIKEAKGDDFGTYGPDRYNRALVNLKSLIKYAE